MLVHDRTWTILSVALLATLALATGWLRVGDVIESRGDRLWTPQDSEPQRHAKYVKDRFNVGPALPLQVLADDKADPTSGNVLTPGHVRELFSAYRAAFSAKTAGGLVSARG